MKERRPHPAINSWERYQRREARKEAWRYWSRTLWRVYRWLLLSMLSPAIMIAMGMAFDGEPGSKATVWIGGVVLAFVPCWGIWTFVPIWRDHVAMRLYFEDIADGACPDRGWQISRANGLKWYRKQGSPWWISAKRERPWAHPGDAIARLEGREPPLRQRPKW
ncbi:hypothetical protein [Paraburkholderia elongata]|uniref:Uncharacterized protein n=1 Tax=Paraburkholderia elongata TaxID=2675747 RepID=A0A972NSQ4_9BURK|nr:hypothetical protein [Paraburkholderia elongata]NPT57894.1 hypothetical protein [Paraburkholderia elongata]